MNVKAVVALSSALSLLAGAAAGYLVAQKRLEKQFQEKLDREIAETKAYLGQTLKGATPSDVLAQRRPGLTVPEGASTDPEEQQAVIDTGSKVATFIRTVQEQRYGRPTEQVDDRNPNKPHVIRHDEFFGQETGYDQFVYTWYKGDETLADQDEEIADISVVGRENMERFGDLSNDPNVVYIRNDNLRTEFEVLISEGTYKELVAGFTDED